MPAEPTSRLPLYIRSAADEDGQTIIEYMLIAAFLSIVAIAVMGAVGADVTRIWQTVADAF